ncbi:hypothetical protein [Ktedonobacter robiniae]|uniref:PhoD-like phosphatase metallophosphatase domain-containing protein n=1 Tax=Ktedonobacter robiniae TaxID=2778365 RepID=A0ABQ3UKC0_9CHLR|nr:hypothetical protein [Ktedonobacter robiniae]GHO53174.1 hypothetical protein KSB_16490 [Ktedonobacter robiniae]
MSWTPLTERIDELPLILAGPILRRTEPGSVTVWLALKAERLVTLHILEAEASGALRERFQGKRKTVRLGDNLHLVAVTAQISASVEPLDWGELYYYNLSFQAHQEAEREELYTPGILRSAEQADDPLASLIYPGHPLPSFLLPASKLEQVRFFHGSCRKAHGSGREMLSALDLLIEKSTLAGDHEHVNRPQQLYLTGDQVYADDVAPPLLFALMDAGEALFSDQRLEILPGVRQPASNFAPGMRRDIIHQQARFTSKTPDSHLLSFAEYASMYLMSWSDQLWPETLPGTEELWQRYPASRPAILTQQDRDAQHFMEWNAQLERFRAQLPHVRRALANIATYMICDDHDVTDDWFLDGAWCQNVLNSQAGRHIVRNGLLAYTLFQAWGNTPEQFADSSGQLLLSTLDSWQGQEGTEQRLIDELIGMPLSYNGPGELERSKRALHWHYTYEAPSHQVIVMDTRTQRHYDSPKAFPGLLSPQALQEQIVTAVQPEAQVNIIISAAPVLGIDFIENVQFWNQLRAHDNYSMDCEAWGLEWGAFQQFLRAVSGLKRAVILAGDVHYAFGSSMEYWDMHTGETARLINFTASPLCNEGAGEHMAALALGYPRLLRLQSRGRDPYVSFLAWDLKPDSNLIFQTVVRNISQHIFRFWWSLPRLIATHRSQREIVLPSRGWLPGTFKQIPPDRVYRIRYLQNTRAPETRQRKRGVFLHFNRLLQRPQRLALGMTWLLESALRRIRQRTARLHQKTERQPLSGRWLLDRPTHAVTHEILDKSADLEQALSKRRNALVTTLLKGRNWLNKWKAGTLIVGYNNIGEIYFTPGDDGQREVCQRLWWWRQDDEGQSGDMMQSTEYRERLTLPTSAERPPLP